MKNFNILGVHGKIRVLRGFQEKPIYRGGGGSPKSGGARGGGEVWAVCGFNGAWQESGGSCVFERGGDNPMHTMLSI